MTGNRQQFLHDYYVQSQIYLVHRFQVFVNDLTNQDWYHQCQSASGYAMHTKYRQLLLDVIK